MRATLTEAVAGKPASPDRYPAPRERSLAGYLLIAASVFALAFAAGRLWPVETAPPMVEVELGLDAVENQPPPLGEPDAGAGAPAQEQPASPEPPADQPPPPDPDPAPPQPTPPVPQFVVPEEKAPAAPRPRSAATPAREHPHRVAPAGTALAGNGETTGETGLRGSPSGQPGGHGGSRGDFTSTPPPEYDDVSRERRYQGHGTFVIRYQNGQITGVEIQQSTGVSYLDARTIAWVRTRYKVKPGVSGVATLPITWQLR